VGKNTLITQTLKIQLIRVILNDELPRACKEAEQLIRDFLTT